jgi:hypothetical protein
MSILEDGTGTGNIARVNPNNRLYTSSGRTAKVDIAGALAVSPSSPSLPFNATLGVDDTPVEIVPASGS